MNYTGIYRTLFDAYRALPYALGRGRAFPPLHVFIELTYRCNVRCDFCQFFEFEDRAARKPFGDELRFEEIEAVLSELPRFSFVSFTGGELFLRRDVLDILRL
ncbi:MAG TPA: radical SAM protein, partial [Thermoanaerobaculia bacterium]|nr:radical SAM protein [Thermoanaerobaculia bacterium]